MNPVPPTIPASLASELATTSFGKVITNPLASRVIQYALGLIITFISSKVFKSESAPINLQDYVEISMVVLGSVAVIWYRFKATHTIATVVSTVQELVPIFEKVTTPGVKRDLMNVLETQNPKVAEAVKEALNA